MSDKIFGMFFSFPGIRVHSSGILANKGTTEDTRSRGAVGPRAEQLLFAVVRGAYGFHTIGERQS